jgi:hypothetical protein
MWVLIGIDITSHLKTSIETLYAVSGIAHFDFYSCIWLYLSPSHGFGYNIGHIYFFGFHSKHPLEALTLWIEIQ